MSRKTSIFSIISDYIKIQNLRFGIISPESPLFIAFPSFYRKHPTVVSYLFYSFQQVKRFSDGESLCIGFVRDAGTQLFRCFPTVVRSHQMSTHAHITIPIFRTYRICDAWQNKNKNKIFYSKHC